MRVVVADTGPLNYLVQIDAVELLPKLFGRIIVPAAVRDRQGLLDALLAQRTEKKQ